MANNKLKKAALMAGISAASMLPLKSSAQAPVKDKQENKIEISVNPDKIRGDIQLLQTDSTNIARFENLSDRYIATSIKYLKNNSQALEAGKKLLETMHHAYASGNLSKEIYDEFTQFFIKFAVMSESNQELNKNVIEFLNMGVATNTDAKAMEDINNKLAQQRMLLKLIEENTK